MNIELPESLTSIGQEAFWDCSGLTNIELPKSLTSIGKEAFCDFSGLTNIELPENLTPIRGRIFGGCTDITEIIITEDKNNQVFRIVNGVMFDKAMTKLLWFYDGNKRRYSVPDGIISIESGAFGENCILTGISFRKVFYTVISLRLNISVNI
jgi:hypothetical protein